MEINKSSIVIYAFLLFFLGVSIGSMIKAATTEPIVKETCSVGNIEQKEHCQYNFYVDNSSFITMRHDIYSEECEKLQGYCEALEGEISKNGMVEGYNYTNKSFIEYKGNEVSTLTHVQCDIR